MAVQHTCHWLVGLVATASLVSANEPDEVDGGAAMLCSPSLSTQLETVVELAPAPYFRSERVDRISSSTFTGGERARRGRARRGISPTWRSR